jgi:hypothetical protein
MNFRFTIEAMLKPAIMQRKKIRIIVRLLMRPDANGLLELTG